MNALWFLVHLMLLGLLVSLCVFAGVRVTRGFARLVQYIRAPVDSIACLVDYDVLRVGDTVSIRGRADDGELFHVQRRVLMLTDSVIRLEPIQQRKGQ